MKSPPEIRLFVNESSPMNRIVEECTLGKEDGDGVCGPSPFYENDPYKCVKKTAFVANNALQVITKKERERRFFKSSNKRRISAKDMVKQEPIECCEAPAKSNKDDVFYPDCNVSKIMSIENGKIKVKRELKKMFAVVDHVRDSHLIQEFGEDQEVKDDLEYLIDGITGEHSPKVKMHSALCLVKKSTSPEFRSFVRATYSSEDLIKIFGDFHSNQKLSLCFCSLMMIMIKSYSHKEDNTILIGHLMDLHASQYPIFDKETLRMIEVLHDSLNTVKGRNISAIENLELASTDVRVMTLAEMLIFILSSRDETYLKDYEVVKILFSSVQRHLHEMLDSWEEQLILAGNKFGQLHARLNLVTAWLQMESDDRIREFIQKDFLEGLLRICSVCIKVHLSGKIKELQETLGSSPLSFNRLFVEVLQCLGLIVLKGIEEHLSLFQCNFMEQLLHFILFLSLDNKQPQTFDLMLLSLEMSINLTKADKKFNKVLTKGLSTKQLDPSFRNCTSRMQCLAKLFRTSLEFPMFKTVTANEMQAKENKSKTEIRQFKASNDASIMERTATASCCLSLSMQNVESSMNSFIISSYIATLIGVVISQVPESGDKILQLLPGKNLKSLLSVLEDFMQFMSECNIYHCHEFLLTVIEFLRS